MARKLEKPKSAAPAAAEGADDLEIMQPDRSPTIAGEKVTVREYGFREGLNLQRACAPVVAALAAAAKNGEHGFDEILGVLADHEDEVIGMVAQACDKPVAWVNELSDADGQLLLLTWWAVNGGFFVRRAQTRMAIELAEKARVAKAKSASAGQTFTPASPSTESSEASTNSGGSPAGR